MIASIAFCFSEAFRGFRQARLASFVAISTITISLILLGIFIIITFNLNRFVDYLRNQVELEVFLDDSFDEAKIKQLSEKIQAIEGIKDITFISKEMAILEYNKLFGNRKSEYLEVLGYNPLPASFRIHLKDDYKTASKIEQVHQALLNLDEISKEDVVYRREYMVTLDKYINFALMADLLIGAIVCLSAILLVSNNIRLIIFSKRKIIETMQLVGATKWFIRLPMFIQGIFEGILGGGFAAFILFGLVKITQIEITEIVTVKKEVYGYLILIGMVLGLLGSFNATRKYLL